MTNLTQKILVEWFYSTELTEEISTLWDIDFTVTVAPINTKGFITINPNSALNKERVYYNNVVWNRIYVKWINRTEPKTHSIWDTAQMNDWENIFNYLSENLSTTFYIEKTGSLAVEVWGWPILKDNEEVSVLDTTLTLTDNTINYICYNHDTNTISKQLSETYVVVAQVTTASWVITAVTYRNHKIALLTPTTITIWTTTTWEAWTDVIVTNSWTTSDIVLDFTIPRWDNWSISEATPEAEQTIVDNSVPEVWTVITTDDSTYIKLTYTNWVYTQYNLASVVTWDTNWIFSTTIKSPAWTFWVSWITYSDWTFVDKITWTTSFTWTVMYKDQDNIVSWKNTFNWDVVFAWQATFRYYVNWTWVVEFDADHWSKQWFNFDSWAATMDFVNLLDWLTITFSVTVNISTVNLDIWTVSRKWDANPYTSNTLTWETYPFDLAVWTHIFVAEVFSAWFHIAYAWTSTAI